MQLLSIHTNSALMNRKNQQENNEQIEASYCNLQLITYLQFDPLCLQKCECDPSQADCYLHPPSPSMMKKK